MDTRQKNLLTALGAYSVCLLAFVLLWENIIVLAVFSILLFLVADRVWHKPNDYLIYLAGALIGTLTEIIMTSRGAWAYAKPTAFGVPLWLPFVWGFAALLMVKIAEAVAEFRRK